ncbi:hypothetical protein HN766_20370 [Candidatus Poribacteria bacterium]|nr:hypothetical protein [Candidatus Poribacteria bacterium]
MADVADLLKQLRSARLDQAIVATNHEALGLLEEIEGLFADKVDDPEVWSIGCHMSTAYDWVWSWLEGDPFESLFESVLGDGYEDAYELGITDQLAEVVREPIIRRILNDSPEAVRSALADSFGHHTVDAMWDQMNTAVTDYAIDALIDLAKDDAFWTEQLAKFRAAHPEASKGDVSQPPAASG